MVVTDSSVFTVGDRVFGPGIASGTTVAAKPTATSVTLSAAANAAGTGKKMTFVQASKKGHTIQSNGSIALASAEELKTSAGVATASNLVPVTKLALNSSDTRTLTLSTTDAVDGQIKYLVVTVESSTGQFAVQTTNAAMASTIVLQTLGHSAMFMYDDEIDKWVCLSSNTP